MRDFMGVLVFRCPASGETINSGVHTDESSLAKVRSLSVKLYCPVCQTMHLMRASRYPRSATTAGAARTSSPLSASDRGQFFHSIPAQAGRDTLFRFHGR
jgi:predicted RNA-binding Zn-ribbon protein involved in translation (DUF1610 family)